jgi:thymidylate synthase
MFIHFIKTDDEFAKKWGELGPIYGKQWRDWNGKTEVRYPGVRDENGHLKPFYIKNIRNRPNPKPYQRP